MIRGLWFLAAFTCNLVPNGDGTYRLPINELGEECPWPFEPWSLYKMPMGQYHCGYCGGMNIAGMSHLDWKGDGFV